MSEQRRIVDEAEPAPSGQAGHRLCAATRAELPTEALIRFVAGPDGVIVPDLARRLPGRGVWISGEKAVVAQAVAGKVFSKSLKRQAKADSDLPERVEALITRRAMDALSLANKAGLVVAGFQQVDAAVEAGNVEALVHGSDAAPGGAEKLDRKFVAVSRANGRNAPIVTCLSTEQMSLAMGRSNVVHAALTKGGIAQRFLSEAKRLERYRSGSCSFRGQEGSAGSEV